VRTIDAALFELLCKELVDEVAASSEPVVITRNGKPIAQLAPVVLGRKSIWGLHKGEMRTLGDITSPIDVEWKANR
jgi:antitoxin (DNA-binding transcriptional repressor) of toxin-antitoxin stability system